MERYATKQLREHDRILHKMVKSRCIESLGTMDKLKVRIYTNLVLAKVRHSLLGVGFRGQNLKGLPADI